MGVLLRIAAFGRKRRRKSSTTSCGLGLILGDIMVCVCGGGVEGRERWGCRMPVIGGMNLARCIGRGEREGGGGVGRMWISVREWIGEKESVGVSFCRI